MSIPDATIDEAIQAAEKACAVYGQRTPEGNIELHLDDLDMIADAVKASAQLIAAQVWLESATWHEEYVVRHKKAPLFDDVVYANPYGKDIK